MAQEKHRADRSTYKTKYPFNKVTVTQSGHEFHFDDTPGAERIRIAHRSGTYTEISADGRKVDVTVGNEQKYNRGGVTMTIDHNSDVKIHGHHRFLVGGGSHIEVAGDAGIVVGGDSMSVVAGNMSTSIAGNAYMGVKGNMNMNVSGSMNMEVAGDTTMKTGGTHTVVAAKIDMNP